MSREAFGNVELQPQYLPRLIRVLFAAIITPHEEGSTDWHWLKGISLRKWDFVPNH